MQEIGIGKTVNCYRKHHCETVGNFARHLVAKWKQLVQSMTEAISDTQCDPAARDDMPITADVKDKALVVNHESKVDEQHLGTSSSKHEDLSASGSNAASKHHSSSTVEHVEVVKQDVDVMFSKPCSQAEVSATSLTPPWSNDRHGDSINSSQNKSAVQRSAYRSSLTEHQKLPAGNLLMKNMASTSHKSRHEKHSRLNKSTSDKKSKGKYHLDRKVSAKAAKYKSYKAEGQDVPAECVHTDNDFFDTERIVIESGREVPDHQVETNLSKSLRKSASKTNRTVVHKGSASVNVPSSAKTHIFSHRVSQDQNQADLKTFTVDAADDSEHNGIMTFEEMLNYDNHVVIAKKNKGGGVFSGSKRSKVPKSISHNMSYVSPAVTKQAGKPDSGHVSRHMPCLLQTLHTKKSAQNVKLERSLPIQHPVIPCPESRVGTEVLRHFVTVYLGYQVFAQF